MLLTLTCTAPNAPEVGYLFGKNPASVFQREFSAGTVWVFYPQVAPESVTLAVVTVIDAVGLVRGPAAFTRLDQYVNDRPYVASSLTSVALMTAFSSALAGRCKERPELVEQRFSWEARLPAVACDAGEDLITRIFAPLGYAVVTTRLPLDPAFPSWGQADLYSVTLSGEQTVRDLLSHLYVLLPVLDNSKHYFVGAEETEKLLAHGGAWLAAHPERELITRRYLRYKRPLIQSALARLAESDPQLAEEVQGEAAEAAAQLAENAAVTTEAQPGLHAQRLQAVLSAAREIDARTLADIGCGEGRLLELALGERTLTRIVGMDVSSAALARARRRLHLETLAPAQRQRLELLQGSLLYRDRRLEGFDMMALVEVVEHLDAARLGAMERVVFEHARPRRVVVTTPNREYNIHWENVGAERLRHDDHRFEWRRAEGQAWAEHIAQTYGYRYQWREIGPADEAYGAPSQLIVFDRTDTTPPAEARARDAETREEDA